MKLTSCVHQFFDQYLPQTRGVGINTIRTYRDTIKLFLPFAAQYHNIRMTSLTIDHLTVDMVLAFLNDLEQNRNNITNTRNQRLAVIKSLARMIRFTCPEKRRVAENILNTPQKRAQKKLIGFLYPEEIMKVLNAVTLTQQNGFRDYTILHLLYDSGARASEIGDLNLDYFDPDNKTLAILGKGNKYRQIELNPKTVDLIKTYISRYRPSPKPLYHRRIFINQRGEELTRHGIYRLCKKYLTAALPAKRLQHINPAHSFRHSCAVRMLMSGSSISEIRNHLGHEDMQSTTIYLHLNLARKQQIQKQLIEYRKSMMKHDPNLDALTDWENKKDVLSWLDSL